MNVDIMINFKISEKFESEIWPWNTGLIYDHLNQPFYWGAQKTVWKSIRINDSSLHDEFKFAEASIKESSTPIVYRLINN